MLHGGGHYGLRFLRFWRGGTLMPYFIGGYIGDSTRAEIEYAKVYGKPVRYLEECGNKW